MKVSKYGHIAILCQTRDLAISIDKNFWAILTLNLRKLLLALIIRIP